MRVFEFQHKPVVAEQYLTDADAWRIVGLVNKTEDLVSSGRASFRDGKLSVPTEDGEKEVTIGQWVVFAGKPRVFYTVAHTVFEANYNEMAPIRKEHQGKETEVSLP